MGRTDNLPETAGTSDDLNWPVCNLGRKSRLRVTTWRPKAAEESVIDRGGLTVVRDRCPKLRPVAVAEGGELLQTEEPTISKLYVVLAQCSTSEELKNK